MHNVDQKDYYSKVYKIVESIPPGRVTTYGAIAGHLGVKSGARMVGYALNQLISSSGNNNYPAHRVVNRLGQLTGRGYFPDDTMREMLEQEGVIFTDEYTVDIQNHFWDPSEKEEVD